MSMFPQHDDQFDDKHIAEVRTEGGGWSMEMSDGWSFFVSADSPVEPKPGMPVRMYGKGIGFSVRGLFINGCKVFYRTEEEDEERREIMAYGADAADWLARWDAGKSVWTIEMGGLGPGYEQCIHITCAEILRFMLAKGYDHAAWGDKEVWRRHYDEINEAVSEVPAVKSLGLSGAQYGAAVSLASFLFKDGPRAVMTDERVKDRHIQVSRTFPGMAA